MCVAMVIIHTKTLEKKAVDDAASLPPQEPPAVSQGTALFSCGVMEVGVPQQRAVGSSLESLWDGVRETSGLLRDLSLGEAPPSKRQCRSLSCSGLGCRSAWRPQGSRVWTSVEKRRCLSGGSVQRGAVASAGSPTMQRSSSFSHAAHGLPFGSLTPSETETPQLFLSQERIGSPDASLELERPRRQGGLARSRSQPCVHQHTKSGVKRRRPADAHKHRPSLDLLKMTQKLQDFHSLSCPGFGSNDQTLPTHSPTRQDEPEHILQSESSWLGGQGGQDHILQSESSWPGGRSNGKERECLWAGLCSRRGRDVLQLGGELDIEQIERN